MATARELGPLRGLAWSAVRRRRALLRRLGSAALDCAWVAAGRLDGFWEVSLQPWDKAAGVLLIEEAGGRVSDFAGGAHSLYELPILASNGHIHDAMLRVLDDATLVTISFGRR